MYNLAGLYWRVVGNNYHGIECLRRSLHFVPADYLDVPLVNMANILYKWNKIDDALNLTKQALVFSPYEVCPSDAIPMSLVHKTSQPRPPPP